MIEKRIINKTLYKMITLEISFGAVVSTLAVVGVAAYAFYRIGKKNMKEPIGLLAKFFIAGIIIAIPAAIVEGIVDVVFQIAGLFPGTLIYSAVSAVFGVALVEEGFKFLCRPSTI